MKHSHSRRMGSATQLETSFRSHVPAIHWHEEIASAIARCAGSETFPTPFAGKMEKDCGTPRSETRNWATSPAPRALSEVVIGAGRRMVWPTQRGSRCRGGVHELYGGRAVGRGGPRTHLRSTQRAEAGGSVHVIASPVRQFSATTRTSAAKRFSKSFGTAVRRPGAFDTAHSSADSQVEGSASRTDSAWRASAQDTG
jgi:hypothetical protein